MSSHPVPYQTFSQNGLRAGKPHMRQRPGDLQIEQQQFVTLPLPFGFRSSQERLARQYANLMVIYSKERRTRLRDLKRNYWNAGLAEQAGDFSGDPLVDLKFDC